MPFSVFSFVSFIALAQLVASAGTKVSLTPLQNSRHGFASGLNKRQKQPLVDTEGAVWSAEIGFGTPPQNIVVAMSTRQSQNWVPAGSCNNAKLCDSRKKYTAANSSTKHALGANVTALDDGAGLLFIGPTYTDVVTIGGLAVKDVPFAAIDNVSPGFDEYPIPTDGILKFPFAEDDGSDTLVQSAFKQGLIPAPEFSLHYAAEGSELSLGAQNKDLMDGESEYYGVNPTSKDWQIAAGANVTVNGHTNFTGVSTIISSFGTLVFVPPAALRTIFELIPGSKPQEHNQFSYPCDTPPKISFNWGGKDWEIAPENLVLGKPLKDEPSQCVSIIYGLEPSADTNPDA